MDAFTLVVIGAIVLGLLVFLAIGLWHPARATDVTDAQRLADERQRESIARSRTA